jgi:hypothetical protein
MKKGIELNRLAFTGLPEYVHYLYYLPIDYTMTVEIY